ncbi:MAG: hypothetical protein ACRDBY_03950 [Cetobacterium sp.]
MGILNVKENYNVHEWAERENYYKIEVDKLALPCNPGPLELADYNSRLNNLRDEIGLELAYIERQYDNYYSLRKTLEKAIFYQIKESEIKAGVKNTEKTIEGAVADRLQNHPYPGSVTKANPNGVFINNVLTILTNRLGFSKAIFLIIKDKKEQLTGVTVPVFKSETSSMNINTSQNRNVS